MSSLQSLRELINERLAAAAEEIFRLCEGTIVQYEQELCRQRRLLDICWKPQIQLKVLPQHNVTEDEDLCNQQKNFRVKQEEQEPPQIKEEQEGFYISLDEVKQDTNTLMKIPTYEEQKNSEADLSNQQRFNITNSQDEEETQHEESTTDEERRDRSHVQSVASIHVSESQFDSDIKSTKQEESPNEKTLCFVKSSESSMIISYHKEIPESDERRYICKECGKGFGYWSLFWIHMRTHTGEKPFSCKECDKSFSQKSNLKTHMRTHTGEKHFACQECNKSFSHLSILERHMRAHTKEKPFSCKECHKSYSQKSDVIRHMRTHTGEKPLSCKECNKRFSDVSNLKAHMRTHT